MLLPEEFSVRVGVKYGYFDDIQDPRFDGYRVKSIIQYNRRTNHFRCIKQNYGSIHVMDGTGYELWQDLDRWDQTVN